MKFRRDENDPIEAREEVRDLAEALSLYRSAMHHIAERETARSRSFGALADRRPVRKIRFGLLLAPALAAAVAAAALAPIYRHLHHPHVATPAQAVGNAQATHNQTLAAVDDATLMTKIDSEVSEDVPDALRPLADLSSQTTTTSSVLEKKNATQE